MTVLEIQEALQKVGFYTGKLDGDIGPLTRTAVKKFQARHGLTADGIVGPATTAVFVSQGLLAPDASQAPRTTRSGRAIHTLVIHCTATPEGREFTRSQINDMHIARGFGMIGYHKIIHLDGSVEQGRPDDMVGAHVSGHNVGTLGYSYIGGLDSNGNARDTRTDAQKASIAKLVRAAYKQYKIRSVLGHRDLSPDKDHDGVVEPWEWVKQCPCFNVIPEYGKLLK